MAASGSAATLSVVSDAIASGSCVHGSSGSTLVMGKHLVDFYNHAACIAQPANCKCWMQWRPASMAK